MNKRELSKIPRPTATAEEIEKAQATNATRGIVARVCKATEDTVEIDIFDIQALRTGKIDAICRTYITSDDYITQDLTVTRTRWLTGKLSSILDLGTLEGKCSTDLGWLHVEHLITSGEDLIYGITGRRDSWFEALTYWQADLRAKRTAAKNWKDLEPTRKLMDTVRDCVPADFNSWVRDSAMEPYQPIFYDPAQKREVDGYCTHCHQKIRLDRKTDHPMKDRIGRCPNCGHAGKCVTSSSVLRGHDKVVCLMQAYQSGILVRAFDLSIHFKDQKIGQGSFEPQYALFETVRWFIEPNEEGEWPDWGSIWNNIYCFGAYKSIEDVWSQVDFKGHKFFLTAQLYTKNAREVLAGTPWKHSGLVEYQEHSGNKEIPLSSYMREYLQRPWLEFVAKAGMTRMCADMCDLYPIWDTEITDTATSLPELFRVSKKGFKMLRQINGDRTTLTQLQGLEKAGIELSAEDLHLYGKIIHRSLSIKELSKSLKTARVSLHKFLCYLIRQTYKAYPTLEGKDTEEVFAMSHQFEMNPFEHVYNDWDNYISMAEKLAYPLHDTYYFMPPDLHKAHDRAVDELNNLKMKMQERESKQIAECAAKMEGQDVATAHTDRLMIRIPKSAEDLVAEGSHNHNCVGTYVSKVANGETLILFIRRIEDQDTPYYTMEYRDGRLIQCRGYRNKDAEGDILIFAKTVTRMLIKQDQKRKEVPA